jgi:hypothetical protein
MARRNSQRGHPSGGHSQKAISQHQRHPIKRHNHRADPAHPSRIAARSRPNAARNNHHRHHRPIRPSHHGQKGIHRAHHAKILPICQRLRRARRHPSGHHGQGSHHAEGAARGSIVRME